jgi:hypothetical protein
VRQVSFTLLVGSVLTMKYRWEVVLSKIIIITQG